MKVISINVGLPGEIRWKDKVITTSIFKEPISGSVMLRKLNVDGDKQSNLTVHGGINKAVYAYPSEHYDYWQTQSLGIELSLGVFGENLTIEGLTEYNVHIGDRFKIGSAELMVTEPRLPCFKLGLRFGREDIIKRFLNSGRTGFYFAVMLEGKAQAGNALELIHRDPNSLSVADVVQLYTQTKSDLDLLRRAALTTSLPQTWRDHFSVAVDKLSGS